MLDAAERQSSEDQSELQLLEQSVTQLQQQLHDTQASVSAIHTSSQAANKQPVVPSTSQVKEYFVYLGTGSSSSRDWTDINSTLATVDTTQYGTIKSVNFEATLSIISGEVYARLKNVSTGAIYHASAVTHNTSTSQWRTSQTFQLPAGANQYVVQLSSSNGELARLDGSRIKIVVH